MSKFLLQNSSSSKSQTNSSGSQTTYSLVLKFISTSFLSHRNISDALEASISTCRHAGISAMAAFYKQGSGPPTASADGEILAGAHGSPAGLGSEL